MKIVIARSLGCLSIVLALLPAPLFSQGRNYGRSIVITQQGIAATSQVLASQAGAQILARGGSAVDAAIAANAVLAVVEPMMDGLGGDLFVLYWDAKTGKLHRPERIRARAARADPGISRQARASSPCPRTASTAVTVPGAVDGWYQMHQRFGKLPWKDLFQSAIAYAEQGFPVYEGVRRSWAAPRIVQALAGESGVERVFLPGGKPPLEGEVFRNPEMAHAFRLIAEQGPDAFYKGEIAAAILKTSAASWRHDDRPGSRVVIPRNGWSRSPSIIAAGAFTNCRPTARAWPRSRC